VSGELNTSCARRELRPTLDNALTAGQSELPRRNTFPIDRHNH
jgi:hypothetical protein